MPCSVTSLSRTMTVVELSALFCALPVPQPPPESSVAVHAPGEGGCVQLNEYESPIGFSPQILLKPPVQAPGRAEQSCGTPLALPPAEYLSLCAATLVTQAR